MGPWDLEEWYEEQRVELPEIEGREALDRYVIAQALIVIAKQLEGIGEELKKWRTGDRL